MKGSGANHYPRAPAQVTFTEDCLEFLRLKKSREVLFAKNKLARLNKAAAGDGNSQYNGRHSGRHSLLHQQIRESSVSDRKDASNVNILLV